MTETTTQPEQIIDVNGVRLCVQATGHPSDPAVLLVAGTSCSMDWWPPDFCAALADRGFFVIRFDQRDTGRAHHDPPGAPDYALPDMVADAVGVLDACALPSAHWVGFSQGGWITQLAALDHPTRVASLVLVSTRATGHGPADADLPEVSARLLAEWATTGAEPDWTDRQSALDALVAGERSLASEPFDEETVRDMCRTCLDRTSDITSAVVNHPIVDQGPRWRERLAEIEAPTLVLHGDQDPLFPHENGERLAAAIPHARFRLVPQVGHEVPRRVWSTYLDAVIDHIHSVLDDPEHFSNSRTTPSMPARTDREPATPDADEIRARDAYFIRRP